MADEAGSTPLHLACREGHSELAKLLILSGAEVDARDSSGVTSLYDASERGRLELVDLLTEKGAVVNIGEEGGFTPVHIATQGGYAEVVNTLAQRGAQCGHVPVAVALIEQGADVNFSRDDGVTPLIKASEKGHDKVVEFLLQNGAKITMSPKALFMLVLASLAVSHAVSDAVPSTEQLYHMIRSLSDDVSTLNSRVDTISPKRAAVQEIQEKRALAPGSISFHAKIRQNTYGVGDTLTASSPITNEGNAFDDATGIFTAPTRGTYVFLASYNVRFDSPRKTAVWFHMRVDDRIVNYCHTAYPGYHLTGACHAVVKLNAGQKVWLRNVKDESRYGASYFSGFLLNAN
nr:hypothetical protein BaRGS_014660 [Batillaria attramentaria]